MNKEDYAVVEFIYETVDDQPLVQEVPVKWLSDNETMCWWPPRNPFKEIKGATAPDITSWQKHHVRVRKVYRDMNEARQRCLVPSDFEEGEMGKHRRTKKETFKHMFRDTSHSPPPQPPSTCHEKYISDICIDSDSYPGYMSSPSNQITESDSSTSSQTAEDKKYQRVSQAPASTPANSCEFTSLTNMIRSSSRSLGIELHPNLQEFVGRQQSSPAKPANSANNSNDEIKFCLETLTDEIGSMRKQMQEVVLHVTNIGEMLDKKFKGKSEINKKFKDIFPLKNEDSLRNLSSILDEDSQFAEDLKLYLNGIGGSGPKDHHGRIFRSIFTNEFGMKCSWKGLRGNIRLENVNFIGTCMYVLKQNWKTTDKEFEVFSQEWLRHCAQRKKREDEKHLN